MHRTQNSTPKIVVSTRNCAHTQRSWCTERFATQPAGRHEVCCSRDLHSASERRERPGRTGWVAFRRSLDIAQHDHERIASIPTHPHNAQVPEPPADQAGCAVQHMDRLSSWNFARMRVHTAAVPYTHTYGITILAGAQRRRDAGQHSRHAGRNTALASAADATQQEPSQNLAAGCQVATGSLFDPGPGNGVDMQTTDFPCLPQVCSSALHIHYFRKKLKELDCLVRAGL